MISAVEAARLAERVRAGEPGAEEALVEAFGQGIRVVLRRAAGGSAAAQDLFQDTFRLAIEKMRRGELREPEKLPGFLCQIARNLAVEHFRREARRRLEPGAEEVQAPDPGPSPLDRVLAEERAVIVRQVLAELNVARDRELLLRFYLGEEDKETLCREMAISPLHFHRVLFRARQRCKELLERRLADRAAGGPAAVR
jgi:RNA polymerase sigma-70 factor, ECF subfamily